MFCDRRSWWASSAAVALLLAGGSADAGEELTIEQNAALAAGAAVVSVELGGKKRTPEVKIVRVLQGLPADLRADASWFGLCVPNRQSLRAWPIQYAKWPARASWRKAVARGRYEAVVFVDRYAGAYRPRCGVEAMQMRHTDVSAGYVAYQKEVEEALGRRQQGPKR